ncbi:MAG TPA: hypothetical protein VF877_06740 [Gaiellaceae bacterium]
MTDATSLKLTPACLAELWREVALYLEIWDLIRQARLSGHSA